MMNSVRSSEFIRLLTALAALVAMFCVCWVWAESLAMLVGNVQCDHEQEVVEVRNVMIPWSEVHDQNTIKEDKHGCFVTGCRIRE